MTTNSSSLLVRLNKAIAQAGWCSRRKADSLIKQGQVKVNGAVVKELGTKIYPDSDSIVINNQPLPKNNKNKNTLIALHKPVQVVSTLNDPQKRKTIVDLLSDDLSKRHLVPVGRLDYMSEGLLLMSNYGELTYRLTHPRWHIPKKYRILVKGDIVQSKLQKMRQGMRLNDQEKLSPVPVNVIQKVSAQKAWLELSLFQGINRQIRRMCEENNWIILRLIRISQGPVTLGRLRPGDYRFLSPEEEKELRLQVGL